MLPPPCIPPASPSPAPQSDVRAHETQSPRFPKASPLGADLDRAVDISSAAGKDGRHDRSRIRTAALRQGESDPNAAALLLLQGRNRDARTFARGDREQPQSRWRVVARGHGARSTTSSPVDCHASAVLREHLTASRGSFVKSTPCGGRDARDRASFLLVQNIKCNRESRAAPRWGAATVQRPVLPFPGADRRARAIERDASNESGAAGSGAAGSA
jgi:hypothetical protein